MKYTKTILISFLSTILLLISFKGFALSERPQLTEETKNEMKRLSHLAFDNLSDDPELSLAYCNQLEKLAYEKQDTVYWAYALHLNGLTYLRQLNYPAALRVNSMANKLNPNDCYTLLNLAITHRRANNFQDGLYYYDKALEFASVKQRPRVLLHIAEFYFDKGDTEKAFEYVAKASNQISSCEDSIMAQITYSYFYLEQKENTEAKKYLDRAIQLINSCDNSANSSFYKSTVWNNLGTYYLRAKEHLEAEQYLEKSLELADKKQLKHVLKLIYPSMQKVAALKGDMEMLEYYQEKEDEFNESQSRLINEYYEMLIDEEKKKYALAQEEFTASDELKNILLAVVSGLFVSLLILYLLMLYTNSKRMKKMRIKLEIVESQRAAEEKQKIIYEARLATHMGNEDELPGEA
jgi:tetratricopeptide (TPR) repeat protein